MSRTLILRDFVSAANESHSFGIDRKDSRWREAGAVGIGAVQDLETAGSNFPNFADVTTVHGQDAHI